MKTQIKLIVVVAFVLIGSQLLHATTRIVDKGGGGQYTTIQAAINASAAGDTIKALPGVYNEALIINKNVVLQGSGYETTIITSSNNPTITMSSGKVMWIAITSSGGDGAQLSGGTITNCVISGCTGRGAYFPSGSTGSIKNSVLISNGRYAAQGYPDFPTYPGNVSNSIARNNNGGSNQDQFYTIGGLTYSVGKYNFVSGASNNIDQDPLFISSSDFRIGPTSPCWDAGNPADLDPDGSRSDMGYYGGFDAPVFPVVTDLRIILNSDGTVTVRATGKSRY